VTLTAICWLKAWAGEGLNPSGPNSAALGLNELFPA